jgi:GrpB-like predicted nucleotidyltransferase (UPF0157 family)
MTNNINNESWYPNVPYNNIFPILFKKEGGRIKKFINNSVIEHIGSTSVPNLDGKGYIDLMVCVPKRKMSNAKNILEQKLGYEYKDNVSIPGERLFFKRITESEYSKETYYHLHLTYLNSKDYKEAISFRNFLINNPDYVKKYSEIKKIASKEAQKAKDRVEARTIYKKIKDPLIKEILSKALKNN